MDSENVVSIGWFYGLVPIWYQAITWLNADFLSTGAPFTNMV